jgi:hypothetical protein
MLLHGVRRIGVAQALGHVLADEMWLAIELDNAHRLTLEMEGHEFVGHGWFLRWAPTARPRFIAVGLSAARRLWWLAGPAMP